MSDDDKLLAEWFWTDRWDGSSASLLPMEARGLYREMLTQAWRRGGRLPNDPDAIQRAVRCSAEEWSRCWPKVRRYWTVDGDWLVNRTQQEVYAKAKASCDASRERSKRGAAARWRNAQAHAQASGRAKPEQCPPSPSPSQRIDGLNANSATPAPVVPLPQRPQAGRPAGEGRVPSNPLVDRRAYEAEFLRLVRELADLTDRDPVEVAREASSYEGARTSPINPASMTDDRLANSVLDLRSNIQAAKAKAERESRGIREVR